MTISQPEIPVTGECGDPLVMTHPITGCTRPRILTPLWKKGDGIATVDVGCDTADVDDATVEERIRRTVIDRYRRRRWKDDGTIGQWLGNRPRTTWNDANHVRVEHMKNEAPTTGRYDRTFFLGSRYRDGTSRTRRFAIRSAESDIVALDGYRRRCRRFVRTSCSHRTHEANGQHGQEKSYPSHTHYSRRNVREWNLRRRTLRTGMELPTLRLISITRKEICGEPQHYIRQTIIQHYECKLYYNIEGRQEESSRLRQI